MTKFDHISIGDLYDRYLRKGLVPEAIHSGHELIHPDDDLEVLSSGGNYKSVRVLSRHKTTKELVKISCSNSQSIIVTTDHICMAYNDDWMLENMAAKDLKVGSFIKFYDSESKKELNGSIVSIEYLGATPDYVYDLELDDESHVYYANDILVHNSLFLNLQAVTQDFAKTWKTTEDPNKWTDEQKLKLFDFMEHFVDETLIPEIQELVTQMCHTSNAGVLRYGLEYIGSAGIYESPKHYGVHKIIDEGPELVDKFKFTGIEIKKATTPPEIKALLKDVYCTAIVDSEFDDSAMIAKLNAMYDKIRNMSVDELGQWRGYNTGMEMGEGFLNTTKGMTGISKAVGYYNQIIKDMGLGGKYGTIEVGEKLQTIYLKPTNKYGVDIIAFKPRNWPKEFDDVFEVDRVKMFDKLIISPLKHVFEALHLHRSSKYNPSVSANLAYSLDDL